MAVYWGVDSAAYVNVEPPGLTTGQTLYQYVAANFGTPAFWGRYIGGNYALTSGEVSYLHDPSRNCKILLIYNGATAASVSGTETDGENDANAAIAAAQALSVPAGVCIFADIEAGWNPSSAWIEGWSNVMFNSDYRGAGGIYGDFAQTNMAGPYCTAWNNNANMRNGPSYVYTSEPEPGCTGSSNIPAWAPSGPSCNPTYTIAWQYAEGCGAKICYNNTTCFDEDEVNGAVGFACLW